MCDEHKNDAIPLRNTVIKPFQTNNGTHGKNKLRLLNVNKNYAFKTIVSIFVSMFSAVLTTYPEKKGKVHRSGFESGIFRNTLTSPCNLDSTRTPLVYSKTGVSGVYIISSLSVFMDFCFK